MIQKIFVTTLLTLTFSAFTFAQDVAIDTTKRKNNTVQIAKRVDKNSSSITQENVSPVIEPTPTVDVSQRTKGTQVSSNSNAEFPKPATKTNETISVSSAKYIPNTSMSILDNLIEMLELKDKVNDSPNSASLKSSADYLELQSNINVYRTNFENHINSIGFENCSTKEQNYYLSYLKNENRMVEYNLCLSKLNN